MSNIINLGVSNDSLLGHYNGPPVVPPSLQRTSRLRYTTTGRSLGRTSIRMPIGPTLTQMFNEELADQDFPTMLGLEHHKLRNFSTEELEDAFTHRPTNITDL